MTLKLVVKSEASCEPEELLLSESSHDIGRMHDNDLSIQIDCVSGYHAELKQTADGGYAISDLHSTNGTFLNDRRVTSFVKVKPGDQLKLGDLLIAVEEHVEMVLHSENESFPRGYPGKFISLKEEFDFTSEESFYTNPITPIRTPPAIGNVSEVLKHPGRMEEEEPDPESGIAAQQTERVREAERVQQIQRAREAERAQQTERAREAERVQQIERAREAERAQQIERAREAERVQQVQRAREAERAQQIERAREAERVQQVQRAREAERAQQIERVREAERVQQVQRAREAERAQQIERAREAERVQQIQRVREAERVQQIERAREAERVQQVQRAREAERVQQIERVREAERVQQVQRAREAERAREVERVQQIERAREAEHAEADLREGAEPATSENFRSKFQNLTAQLESAMREIKRLKAHNPDESPETPRRNGHAAPPANPRQPIVRRREDHVMRRSGNDDVTGQF